MIHDYAHCLDFRKTCPDRCFRAQLVRDLDQLPYPQMVDWAHFKDSDECIMKKETNG